MENTSGELMVTERLKWRKSTRSGNGDCVEVATNIPSAVYVRDSKAPGQGTLTFDPEVWKAFVADVKTGHYDRS